MTRERLVVFFWMLLVFVLAVVAVSCLTACGPRLCKKTNITISPHPAKPRPAGRITVGCDDEVVSEIVADEVQP